MNWTSEQILALSPDDASAKAGKGLAAARKWVTLGANEAAAWGECQGSGKDPYQARIELLEPAFKCTCPSRKFPCKHGLGLFLLLAAQPEAFKDKEPPGWVSEWLAGRAKKEEQRTAKEAAKAEGGEAKPVDTTAQARRVEAREKKVAAGLAELELWLRDLVRQGLATVQGQPYGFWEGRAARLVDAQAPGVARLVREMAGISASGEGWQERLLEKLGLLHLLLEGYKRLDQLPPATQADIRLMVGWTQNQDELMAQPGVHDHWLVLGQYAEMEEQLRVQRTYLWGRQTNRPALILNFAHASQPLDRTLPPGVALDADLVFFPGKVPLRALLKARHGGPTPLLTKEGPGEVLPGYATVAAAIEAHAVALACNPWLERVPFSLTAVVPVRVGEAWAVCDAAGQWLALAPNFESGWRLRALSGGHPLALFGEWNGQTLLPLGVFVEGRFQTA